mgnify:CR=1 FL=1
MNRDWSHFPNLQLIGERFYNVLQITADQLREKVFIFIQEKDKEDPEYFKTHARPLMEMRFEILGVFQQSWPNTAGLFENGGLSGQAISTYYTTVIYDEFTGYYGVFQENNLVYAINNWEKAVLNLASSSALTITPVRRFAKIASTSSSVAGAHIT